MSGAEIALIAATLISAGSTAYAAETSGGGTLEIPAASPVPARTDEEAVRARRAEENLRRKRGRRQTTLTGGLGVTDEAPVARATLGG